MKFIPKIGDGILWTNCKKNKNKYEYLKDSFHGGKKVLKGEKIGLNIWILDKNS